jgi:allantoate deiminase
VQTTEITTRAGKVIGRCLNLASFSEDSGSLRRTFLSPSMHECHRAIAQWMEPLGAQVRVDGAGNFRGVYSAAESDAPRLLIGSHLDTVPNAGAYDGVLGVVVAIALLEELRGRRLPFAIEVVGFSEEEGVRFGAPFIGSRALAGRLDQELLDVRDSRDISVREAIEDFGLNPKEISDAELQSGALGYLEFHIEQGPVLEQLSRPLAAVEAIVGQSRLELTFLGRANHAGTTPMHLRYDAIAGAAQWTGIVERTAREVSGLVATVGKIEAKPGAVNVIAAEARLTLDVRHSSDEIRTRAVEDLIRQAQGIAASRGLSVRDKILLSQPTVAMDPFLVQEIEQAIIKAGCPPHRMFSGAGHDAMIVAEKVPSAMLFLRTPGGISHDPAESVAEDDVEKAIACGMHLLDQLASSPNFYKRTHRA